MLEVLLGKVVVLLRNALILEAFNQLARLQLEVLRGRRGAIDNCINKGNVIGGYMAGGIAGSASSVSKCYNNSEVVCNQGNPTGGIAGYAYNVEMCFSLSYVSGRHVGGICGSGYVYDSYVSGGTVECTSSNGYAGGIAGTGSATNCYFMGKNYPDYGGAILCAGTATNCYFIKGAASQGLGTSASGEAIEIEEKDMYTDEFLTKLIAGRTESAWVKSSSGLPVLNWTNDGSPYISTGK